MVLGAFEKALPNGSNAEPRDARVLPHWLNRRGPTKYQLLEVSGPKESYPNGFWDQRSSMLGTYYDYLGLCLPTVVAFTPCSEGATS